jgi:hypothetical protein
VGSSRTIRADVRLISATNADLPAEVAAGRFRQDLLFRLNTIQIHLPALRERREDIDLLAQHFLKQHADRYRKAITGFDEEAAGAARLRLAGQRPRAEPRRRAGRPDGAGQGDPRRRPGAQLRGRGAAARRHEPRGGGGLPDQEDPRPLRRERPEGGGAPRPEPERVLPPLEKYGL